MPVKIPHKDLQAHTQSSTEPIINHKAIEAIDFCGSRMSRMLYRSWRDGGSACHTRRLVSGTGVRVYWSFWGRTKHGAVAGVQRNRLLRRSYGVQVRQVAFCEWARPLSGLLGGWGLCAGGFMSLQMRDHLNIYTHPGKVIDHKTGRKDWVVARVEYT